MKMNELRFLFLLMTVFSVFGRVNGESSLLAPLSESFLNTALSVAVAGIRRRQATPGRFLE